MWEPLSLWRREVFSVFSSGIVNASPLLGVGGGVPFLFWEKKNFERREEKSRRKKRAAAVN